MNWFIIYKHLDNILIVPDNLAELLGIVSKKISSGRGWLWGMTSRRSWQENRLESRCPGSSPRLLLL